LKATSRVAVLKAIFLNDSTGKVMTAAIDAELVGEKRPVAVVGTGLVGAGWAIVFARAGHPVRLFDSVPGAAERALEMIKDRLAGLAEDGLINSPEAVLQSLLVDGGWTAR
jgi:NADPH-dependent 2,4-dienoyl-CoA reductase/sulfur reductase-like enzyme